MIKRLDIRDIKEIIYYIYDNLDCSIYLLQGIVWERSRGFVGIRDGSKYYGYYKKSELKALLLFTANGTFFPIIEDSDILKKLDFLKLIKENNPSIIKGDKKSLDGIWKVIQRVVSDYDLKKCTLMKYDVLKGKTLGASQKLSVEKKIIIKKNSLEIINNIDINNSINFLLEVEKAFDRNPLSINKLKLRVNNKNEFDDYIFVGRSGELVGQGIVEFEGPKISLIGGIYTKPDLRGRGIGKVITTELISRISKREQDVYLTVLDENIEAMNLYEKIGFEKIEEYYLMNIKIG
ncbi:MAG: GNAT family N-acetyltransferase [Acidaminobacteraceae bacterium]